MPSFEDKPLGDLVSSLTSSKWTKEEKQVGEWFVSALSKNGGVESLAEASLGWRIWATNADIVLVARTTREVLRTKEAVERAVLKQATFVGNEGKRLAAEVAKKEAEDKAAEEEEAKMKAEAEAVAKVVSSSQQSSTSTTVIDSQTVGRILKSAVQSRKMVAFGQGQFISADGSWVVKDNDAILDKQRSEIWRYYRSYQSNISNEFISVGDCVLLATDDYMKAYQKRTAEKAVEPGTLDADCLRKLGYVGLVTAIKLNLRDPQELLITVAWFWRKRDIISDCASMKKVPAELPSEVVANDWIALYDHTDDQGVASILCTIPVVYANSIQEGLQVIDVTTPKSAIRPFLCTHVYVAYQKKVLEPISGVVNGRHPQFQAECTEALRRGLERTSNVVSTQTNSTPNGSIGGGEAREEERSSPAPISNKRVKLDVGNDKDVSIGRTGKVVKDVVRSREISSAPNAVPLQLQFSGQSKATSSIPAPSASNPPTQQSQSIASNQQNDGVSAPQSSTSTSSRALPSTKNSPSKEKKVGVGAGSGMDLVSENTSTQQQKSDSVSNGGDKGTPMPNASITQTNQPPAGADANTGIAKPVPPATAQKQPSSSPQAPQTTRSNARKASQQRGKAKAIAMQARKPAAPVDQAPQVAAANSANYGRAPPLMLLNPDPSMFDFLNPSTWSWRNILFNVTPGT